MIPDSTAQTQPLRRDDARRLSLAYLAHPHHGGTYSGGRDCAIAVVLTGDAGWLVVTRSAPLAPAMPEACTWRALPATVRSSLRLVREQMA